MNTKSENQQRHETLVRLLNQYPQFKNDEGKGRFKLRRNNIPSHKIKDLSTDEIDAAVVSFVDTLNLGGGSIGDINLYRLLQAYLQNPDCRVQINHLVDESFRQRFEEKKKIKK